MLRYLTLLFVRTAVNRANARLIRVSPNGDSTRNVSIEGYAAVYFGFGFNQPGTTCKKHRTLNGRTNRKILNDPSSQVNLL